jgi:OFA family oxalate/formate antiporter-like MFS transporter
MLWIKLAGDWGHLLDLLGLSRTFLVYGIIFAVVVCVGSFWMVFPPEGWRHPQAPTTGSKSDGGEGLTSGAMLRSPQYYLILISFACGAAAGLMSIGIMKQFPEKALLDSGFDAAKAGAIAGTAAAVYYALANGLGRIVWGILGDPMGCKRAIFVMSVFQGLVVFSFQFMAGTPILLFLGAALIGFNYGGIFALFPTITAETFGTKFIGQNYGWVFLGYAIGGWLGPTLGGKLGDLDNYPLAFTICGLMCVFAGLIVLPLRPPQTR